MFKEVNVLYVTKYDDFTNDATGEVINGATKVTFIDTKPSEDERSSGFAISTMRLPKERFEELFKMEKPFKAKVEFTLKNDRVKFTDLIV